MAKSRSREPKGSQRKRDAAPREAMRAAPVATFLRRLDEPRFERRFEPKVGTTSVVTVLGMSVGAVLVGMGVYGQVLVAEPLAPSPYLLGAGAVTFGLLAAFGVHPPHPVRVGDAGVAVEKHRSEPQRIAWCDVTRVRLAVDAIVVESSATTLVVHTRHHGPAASAIVSEALTRVPDKVQGEVPLALPAETEADSERHELDPPQAIGLRCRASDRLLTLDDDARTCGRCGELYHRAAVPKRCASCGARLVA